MEAAIPNQKNSFTRNQQVLLFCSLLFMGALVVADVTSVKLVSISLFGVPLLVPVGTLAFAVTFLATDVIGELSTKKHAIFVVWAGVFIRVFILIYFIMSIGDERGSFGFFQVPEFWSVESQSAYAFIFSSTLWIYIGGFVAIIISSINDVYVFHYFKDKHAGRRLFWFRNNVSTVFSQIINSTLFISLAFGATLPISGILSAILGQVVFKIIIAFFDTPFAYLMRNYGHGRAGWYKIWSSEFWKG